MTLSDYKISGSEINTNGVVSAPDILTGTTQENKAIFDKLPTLITNKFNALIDSLSASGAAEIGSQPFDEITAKNIQDALKQIRDLIGSYYIGEDGAGKVGYTPSEGVDEDTVQAAIEAVQANLTAYIAKIKAATGAAEVGNAPIVGMTATNVQQALEELRENIDNIVSGIIPGGSITSEMIQDGAVTETKLSSDVAAKLGVLGGATTPQAALANLGAGVRPNIARNPAFAVNQRNFTSDNWTSGYGPDGWDVNGAGHASFDGTVVCTYDQYLCQRYEIGVIKKGKYTISALCNGEIRAFIGYWTGAATQADSTNYQNGLASVTLELSSDDNEKNGYIYILNKTSGGSISYVKVEEGEGQTLGYHDDEGDLHILPQPDMDYATQLAKCQRYYQIYSTADARPSKAVDCRPVMRTDPAQGTIVVGDTTYYYNTADL